MKQVVRTILMLLYTLIVTGLKPLVQALTRVSPRLKLQADGRESVDVIAKRLAPIRAQKHQCVVFFCSSAGEYEQARPLIERLQSMASVYVQVIFFSKSGMDYVTSRRDQVNACLAPMSDSPWEWGWLFSALRPDITAVVRHELWPGFLEAARQYGKLYLIAASRSLGEQRSMVKRIVRTQLFASFDCVYAVSEDDAKFFRDTYDVPATKVRVAGDPKYDRVLERASSRLRETSEIKANLARAGSYKYRLIAGSAHKPDVEALLAARIQMGVLAAEWQLVIAPHHVTPEMIAWVHGRAGEAGAPAVLYSQLLSSTAAVSRPVIILDTMGMLAEVYGTGDAAYVGGALTHQVHNVLEPACRGLAIAYGPFYKNSQEAVQLKEQGLADVVHDAASLAIWWQGLATTLGTKGDAIHKAVNAHAGATDRILTDWMNHLNHGRPS